MKALIRNPLLSPVAVLTVALSLSIGWGIRGNYGHETGAMLPGALAAIAVCILSGRDDWRCRVPYFALFGALGWGFGGSISYMQVIGYTHSGQEESQLFGFYGLFAIGFLWAALGGAGTALPTFLSAKKLAGLVLAFIPLFIIWAALYLASETPIPRMIQEQLASHNGAESSAPADPSAQAGAQRPKMARHEHPLYWFDSDWMVATIVLTAVALFDLVTRRFRRFEFLILLAGTGAMIGLGVQFAITKAGYANNVYDHLVHLQGDVTKFPPYLLIPNWPPLFLEHTEWIGCTVGLILGVALYFAIFGEFRYNSGLYMYMALGWLVGFISLAVLADLHMTPPRGDDWAGIVGVLLFAWLYCLRARWWPALLASIVCGTIGGIGFSGAAWLKLWLLSNGNPNIVSDPAIIESWRHFQHANWHSFLEQTYGFVNGIGVALALALLVRRVPWQDDAERPRSRWPEAFAIFFVLPVLVYVNMVKNLNEWTTAYGTHQPIPSKMKMPLFGQIEWNAWTWFTILYWFIAAVLTLLVVIHSRRRIALVPQAPRGRAELLYLVLLWIFVLGNFAKALPNFNEQRLITEAVIALNAAIATFLLLVANPERHPVTILEKPRYGWLIPVSLILAAAIAAVLPIGQTRHIRHVYDGQFAGHSGKNGKPVLRFGPEATWRTDPNLRGTPHQ